MRYSSKLSMTRPRANVRHQSRKDAHYVPKTEDLVVDEDKVLELKDITDPIERQRMLKAIIKEVADLIAIGTF